MMMIKGKIRTSILLLMSLALFCPPTYASLRMLEALQALKQNDPVKAGEILEKTFHDSKTEDTEKLQAAKLLSELQDYKPTLASKISYSVYALNRSSESKLGLHKTLGDEYFDQNQLLLAEQHYLALSKDSSNDQYSYAQLKLGWIKLNQQKPEEAFEVFYQTLRSEKISDLFKTNLAKDLARTFGEIKQPTMQHISKLNEIDPLQKESLVEGFYSGIRRVETPAKLELIRELSLQLNFANELHEKILKLGLPMFNRECSVLNWVSFSNDSISKADSKILNRGLNTCLKKSDHLNTKQLVFIFKVLSIKKLLEQDKTDTRYSVLAKHFKTIYPELLKDLNQSPNAYDTYKTTLIPNLLLEHISKITNADEDTFIKQQLNTFLEKKDSILYFQTARRLNLDALIIQNLNLLNFDSSFLISSGYFDFLLSSYLKNEKLDVLPQNFQTIFQAIRNDIETNDIEKLKSHIQNYAGTAIAKDIEFILASTLGLESIKTSNYQELFKTNDFLKAAEQIIRDSMLLQKNIVSLQKTRWNYLIAAQAFQNYLISFCTILENKLASLDLDATQIEEIKPIRNTIGQWRNSLAVKASVPNSNKKGRI